MLLSVEDSVSKFTLTFVAGPEPPASSTRLKLTISFFAPFSVTVFPFQVRFTVDPVRLSTQWVPRNSSWVTLSPPSLAQTAVILLEMLVGTLKGSQLEPGRGFVVFGRCAGAVSLVCISANNMHNNEIFTEPAFLRPLNCFI